MPRRPPNGAVETGCGYKVIHDSSSDGQSGTITIVPTTNYANCNVTVGIGNADITFDSSSPPEQLTRIISGDANGDFAPPVNIFNSARSRIRYDDISSQSTQIQDSDGNTQTLEYQLVNGYEKTQAEAGFENIALSSNYSAGMKLWR